MLLGVAMLLTSATETANDRTTLLFHVHLFVRGMMWWWLALARKKMWCWISSFGYSYQGDVLHFAKQLFYDRLQLTTYYFIMREYENIHYGISMW